MPTRPLFLGRARPTSGSAAPKKADVAITGLAIAWGVE
jgi:hypothetical protein